MHAGMQHRAPLEWQDGAPLGGDVGIGAEAGAPGGGLLPAQDCRGGGAASEQPSAGRRQSPGSSTQEAQGQLLGSTESCWNIHRRCWTLCPGEAPAGGSAEQHQCPVALWLGPAREWFCSSDRDLLLQDLAGCLGTTHLGPVQLGLLRSWVCVWSWRLPGAGAVPGWAQKLQVEDSSLGSKGSSPLLNPSPIAQRSWRQQSLVGEEAGGACERGH